MVVLTKLYIYTIRNKFSAQEYYTKIFNEVDLETVLW